MAIDVAEYIRRAAIARGIDPEIALTVARSEGGLKDPFRHGEGPAPRSQDPRFGKLENSFGPFQLYISGTNSGLGDRALAAGIDPRKNWRAGVDFALDEAAKKGWGQWYGAKAAGITGMEGIGGRPDTAPAPPLDAPVEVATLPSHPVIGSPSPQAGAQARSVPQAVMDVAKVGKTSPDRSSSDYLALLGSMSPQQPQFSPVQIMGPSPAQATGLSQLVAALKQHRMA